MSRQFVVTTPKNPQYSGKTLGVLFTAGRAFISEYTVDPKLGRSVEEIAEAMQKEFGYEVQEVGEKLPVVQTIMDQYEPPVEGVDVAAVAEAEANLERPKAKAGAKRKYAGS